MGALHSKVVTINYDLASHHLSKIAIGDGPSAIRLHLETGRRRLGFIGDLGHMFGLYGYRCLAKFRSLRERELEWKHCNPSSDGGGDGSDLRDFVQSPDSKRLQSLPCNVSGGGAGSSMTYRPSTAKPLIKWSQSLGLWVCAYPWGGYVGTGTTPTKALETWTRARVGC